MNRILPPVRLNYEQPIWERQPEEPLEAYRLFANYLNEDPHPMTYEELSLKTRFRWDERRDAWNDNLVLQRAKRSGIRELERQDRFHKLSGRVMEKIEEILQLDFTDLGDALATAEQVEGQIKRTKGLRGKNMGAILPLSMLLREFRELATGAVVDSTRVAYKEDAKLEVNINSSFRGQPIAGKFKMTAEDTGEDLDISVESERIEENPKLRLPAPHANSTNTAGR